MPSSSATQPNDTRSPRPAAWRAYAASVAFLASSIAVGARLYPGPFDWQYTVISALASPKHNPSGGLWFSLGLGLAFLCLWPFLHRLRLNARSCGLTAQLASRALQLGLVFGVLMAIESAANPNLPESLEKLHEALALFAFLSFYAGILALCLSRVRSDSSFVGPAALILSPLIAIGLSQLSLYLGQRDLGWVDQSWRELGVPLWQSFAFWQWLALAFLWLAIGLLGGLFARRPR